MCYRKNVGRIREYWCRRKKAILNRVAKETSLTRLYLSRDLEVKESQWRFFGKSAAR